jgi:hypothetical protein
MQAINLKRAEFHGEGTIPLLQTTTYLKRLFIGRPLSEIPVEEMLTRFAAIPGSCYVSSTLTSETEFVVPAIHAAIPRHYAATATGGNRTSVWAAT